MQPAPLMLDRSRLRRSRLVPRWGNGRRRQVAVALAAVVGVLAAGCSSADPASSPTTTATENATASSGASFTSGPCLDIPAVAEVLAISTCGTLTVPEDRTQQGSPTIELPVVIVPAASPNPVPDPIVYMVGGPGGSALPITSTLVDLGLNAERDLIVMAQRGTSYADPN